MTTKSFLYIIFITAGLLAGCKKRNERLNNRVTPHDFLSASDYNELVIEIDYVGGYEPSGESINNVIAFLQSRLNKPAGVSVVKNSIHSLEGSSYSPSNLSAIEKEQRGEVSKKNKLTAYVLFLDKNYAGDAGSNTKTLGITYGPSSMAIFENTIRSYTGGLAQPKLSDLETSVFEHEFGHVLGLTNNGTPMLNNHQDDSHGNHCDNKKCLMYWASETSDVVANILGDGIPKLDDNCINDLRANGGK